LRQVGILYKGRPRIFRHQVTSTTLTCSQVVWNEKVQSSSAISTARCMQLQTKPPRCPTCLSTVHCIGCAISISRRLKHTCPSLHKHSTLRAPASSGCPTASRKCPVRVRCPPAPSLTPQPPRQQRPVKSWRRRRQAALQRSTHGCTAQQSGR
jgi:hypothetical protein